MEAEVWDSDGCTSSDSCDLPDIVSSDEEVRPWFPQVDPPHIGLEVLIPKSWCYLRTSVLKRHCHAVKVQLLSPLLFGRPHPDKRYWNWATRADLVQNEQCGELQDLELKTLKIIDLLESAHRALLVCALKRPLLIQFVRVVSENLVQCSTLEEAIKVVKEHEFFRDAWKTLKFGTRVQKATALALAGLYYFNHINQYSIDHNDLLEQFEDQCFEEEEQAKIFHEHWQAEMKKQHYKVAIRSLNEAIRVCAFDHLLYEKRAYCYLQLCRFKKVWSDAKRCIVLRPHSIEGHYLYAGALCGKGRFVRALKANSVAIQVCQWKGLNVKGLIDQQELIQAEQELSLKEKQTEIWEKANASVQDQSSGADSFDTEETDEEEEYADDEEEEEEEDGESTADEDDEDAIPAVEDAGIWVKDNGQHDQKLNEQTSFMGIPFLPLDLKDDDASESDKDSSTDSTHCQGNRSAISECDASDTESAAILKPKQQKRLKSFSLPLSEVESENPIKAGAESVAIPPEAVPSSGVDSGNGVPSTSDVDPRIAVPSSDVDTGIAVSSSDVDTGITVFSSDVDTGIAVSSSDVDPKKGVPSTADVDSEDGVPSTDVNPRKEVPLTANMDSGKDDLSTADVDTKEDVALTADVDAGKDVLIKVGADSGTGVTSTADVNSGEGDRSPNTDVGIAALSSEPNGGKAVVPSAVDQGKHVLSDIDPGDASLLSDVDAGKMSFSPMFSTAPQAAYESNLMPAETECASNQGKRSEAKQVQKGRNGNKWEVTLEVEERLIRGKLKEASEALITSNFRSAQESYMNALNLIKEKKVYNLTTLEYIIIQYACGVSFLGKHLIQDILEAEQRFMKILEEFKGADFRHFICLPYYGLSRVYLKWNRYKEARTTLEKSLALVENNLVPGLQMWPSTDTIIEETKDGVLKELLDSLLKECWFHPRPDAVCHYELCHMHNIKCNIYRSDPDFKGFVRVHCSQDCRIEYHVYCWKRCKIKNFQDKIEKEILGFSCHTPDCMGCIWKVDIFQDSRHKIIEIPKPKEKKNSQTTGAKQSSSNNSMRKIGRKKEKKKNQSLGKPLSNIQQEQSDTLNKKVDRSELKDEIFGARKKEMKLKKFSGPSNERIRNDKSCSISNLEETSSVGSENLDLSQKGLKCEEVKLRNSSIKAYLDHAFEDQMHLSSSVVYPDKKSKCNTKADGTSSRMERLTDCSLTAHQVPFAPNVQPHSLSVPLRSGLFIHDQNEDVQSTTFCNAEVLTDPIKPFETRERTFLHLYHERIQLLQDYEKSERLYIRLNSENPFEIQASKEKHEQLVLREEKLREKFTKAKLQLEEKKEKVNHKRKLQAQELYEAQEEFKSVKNNWESNRKSMQEKDTQILKLKEEIQKERAKWARDKKKLQKVLHKQKENCRDLANRIHSAEGQTSEWLKYLELHRPNHLLKKASGNMNLYSTQNAQNIIFLDAAGDMREKRIKEFQGQVNAATALPQYSDGESYTTSSSNFIPSLYNSNFQSSNYSPKQQRASASPTRLDVSKHVVFGGKSASSKNSWILPGSKPPFVGLDGSPSSSVTSLGSDKNSYTAAAWLANCARSPNVLPSLPVDHLDYIQNPERRMNYRMPAGQERLLIDTSVQFANGRQNGGLEIPNSSLSFETNEKIPEISISTLTTHEPGNLQNHLFETSVPAAKSFDTELTSLQSVHPVMKNEDFQILPGQMSFGGVEHTFLDAALRIPTSNILNCDVGLTKFTEPRSSYHAVMELLYFHFPGTSKDVFHSLINTVKEKNGGTLSGLSVEDLVSRVSNQVMQSTSHREMAYQSPAQPTSYIPAPYNNAFFTTLPGLQALQTDSSGTPPDRFTGLATTNSDPLSLETLPLGDLLELECSFDCL